MKDFINAVRGGDHCDWCHDHPPTWWDRLMRFDQLGITPRWYEKIARNWTRFNTRLGIWKLGQKWHYRYHANDNNQS